jgi:TRAP-type C4-dicarboxylate transport system substrate-binding protein
LPFIFKGKTDALAATRGPLGKYRLGAIAKSGIYPFERTWDEGFREVMNAVRPIVTPDDIKGLKIRTPESQVVTATFRALGANATPISYGELYTALQTHLVDGAEFPLTGVEQSKIYQVTKYGSYTNHIWTSYTMLANGETWQKLPKPMRDIVDRRMNQAGDLSNESMGPLEAGVEASLRGFGMQFNRSDIPAFQTVLRRSGLYTQWRNDYAGAWPLLEKAVGSLS